MARGKLLQQVEHAANDGEMAAPIGEKARPVFRVAELLHDFLVQRSDRARPGGERRIGGTRPDAIDRIRDRAGRREAPKQPLVVVQNEETPDIED